MADLVTDAVTIRPYWPLPEWGLGRVSYGVPVTVAAVAFCGYVVERWLAMGMPHSRGEVALLVIGAMAPFIAIYLAYMYDGTAIVASHDQVVLKKWFMSPTAIAVSDIGRVAICNVEFPGGRFGPTIKPAVFFLNRDNRCVISLLSARFRDEDLAELWKIIGVTPDGPWDESVPESKLNERFPGAFDKRAA
jgi:hypothetical protein